MLMSTMFDLVVQIPPDDASDASDANVTPTTNAVDLSVLPNAVDLSVSPNAVDLSVQ